MSSIVTNQQRAFVNQAMRQGKQFASSAEHISPAEQFASLATITAAIGAPIDSVMLTGETSDCLDAAAILDGVLARHPTDRWAWHVGSGCYARIHLLTKEPHE